MRAASRPAAAPSRATARPAASSARQASSSRAATRQAVAPRGRAQLAQRGRSAGPVPYGRNQAAASQGLRQTAMATCTMRGGRRVCSPAAAQPRNVSFRWGSDLPPMTMAQTSCPDGTMATTALGHTDVIRCVPL